MTTQKINVNGTAVRAGLSLNKILYLPEELKKFTPTLKNRPILKDHYPTTDNTIGLITDTAFNNATTEVKFYGWVKEDGSGIIEKIDDGRIKEVSIGGVVGRLVKENLDDDFFIAKDIRAMELSTTPTPGTVGTRIQQTLKSLNEAKTLADLKKVKPVFEQVQFITEHYDIPKKESNGDVVIEVVEKFVCPLCEGSFQSVEELRQHMKIHNKEPDQNPSSIPAKPESLKPKLEERKMGDEQIDVEKQKILEAKEAELKKREQELKVKEDALAIEKRKKLELEYANEAKAKKVIQQDISKLSDETVEALTSQLKVIEADDEYKCPECGKVMPNQKALDKHMSDEHPEEEESANKTKGKIPSGEEKQVKFEDYKITKSEFGSGFAIYRENYDPTKFKRLVRS